MNVIAYLSNVNCDPFLLVGEFRTKFRIEQISSAWIKTIMQQIR